ncbi:MAG: TRAP transporter substrate-binding protein DctP [Clostridium sp.]
MKRLLSLAVAAAMVTSLCACGGGSTTTATTAAAGNSSTTESGAAAATDGKNYDNVTLKLSYATGDTGMDGLTAIEFERLVEEKSGGKVQINRFPNCQLSGGDMVRHVEMMISGGAFELAIISENSFSDVDQTFQVTSIPFAFKNYDEAWEKADSTGGEFAKNLFDKYGVVYLSTFPNGIMQFANNKRELTHPTDMKNLKMRTYGDLQMSLVAFSRCRPDSFPGPSFIPHSRQALLMET